MELALRVVVSLETYSSIIFDIGAQFIEGIVRDIKLTQREVFVLNRL